MLRFVYKDGGDAENAVNMSSKYFVNMLMKMRQIMQLD